MGVSYQIDSKGYYGKFGGAYIPEMLHFNIDILQKKYLEIIDTAGFKKDFDLYLNLHYPNQNEI